MDGRIEDGEAPKVVSDRLQADVQANGPLDDDQVVNYIRGFLNALDYMGVDVGKFVYGEEGHEG